MWREFVRWEGWPSAGEESPTESVPPALRQGPVKDLPEGQAGRSWRPRRSAFLRYFVPLGLLVVVVTASSGTYLVRTGGDDVRTALAEEQRDLVSGLDGVLLRPVVHAAADLAVLVRQGEFLELGPTPTDEQLDDLATRQDGVIVPSQ